MPEFAGTVQILDGYVDLHPWDWLRLRVGKIQGADRPRAPAGRRGPRFPRAGAGLEPVQPAGRRRSALGRHRRRAGPLRRGHLQRIAGQRRRRHRHQPRQGLSGAAVHPPVSHRGPEGLRQPRASAFGAAPATERGACPRRPPRAVTGLSPFRTTGQLTFFQYLAPANDTTGAQHGVRERATTRINPQLYYYYRVVRPARRVPLVEPGRADAATRHAELKQQSAAATLSYTINGRENYDGATPLRRVRPAKGAWGALSLGRPLELAEASTTRHSASERTRVQYASPTASARSAQCFGAAVTWVPRRTRSVRGQPTNRRRFEGGGRKRGMARDESPRPKTSSSGGRRRTSSRSATRQIRKDDDDVEAEVHDGLGPGGRFLWRAGRRRRRSSCSTSRTIRRASCTRTSTRRSPPSGNRRRGQDVSTSTSRTADPASRPAPSSTASRPTS